VSLTDDHKRRYAEQTSVEFLMGMNQYVPPLSFGTGFREPEQEEWARNRIFELAEIFSFKAGTL